MRAQTTDAPVVVTVHVEPGPRYRVGRIVVEGLGPELLEVASVTALTGDGFSEGVAARVPVVRRAEAGLLGRLAERSHPLARFSDRAVAVDHSTRSLDFHWTLDPGPAIQVGAIRILGLERIEEVFVRRRLRLHEGEPWTPDALKHARQRVVDSGVFSSVRLEPGTQPSEDGRLPLDVVVVERPPRRFDIGADYASSDGFGVQASWEHRNLWGQAESLRVGARNSRIGGHAAMTVRKPDWRRLNQNLEAELSGLYDDTDAYDREAVIAGLGWERELSATLRGSLGLRFEQSFIREDGDGRQYTLIGVPMVLQRDTADDLLDPGSGQRTVLTLAPWTDVAGGDLAMLAGKISEAAYLPVWDKPRVIVGMRAALGLILGPGRSDIPADKRFYAGGADTVRGYDYQKAGDLDDEGDPIGGRSLLQFGADLRWSVTETIGLVPFIEAARAFDDNVPDFSKRLFWGTGLGVRWYTPLGPARIDVGLPLNRRDVDDAFEVYISIGQAF